MRGIPKLHIPGLLGKECFCDNVEVSLVRPEKKDHLYSLIFWWSSVILDQNIFLNFLLKYLHFCNLLYDHNNLGIIRKGQTVLKC